jgi:hypothetical protein
MYGLLFIYFIGRSFYRLAERFNKRPWPNAILGIATYYGGSIIFGLMLGVYLGISDPENLNISSVEGWSYLSIPVGLLTCWLTYKYLQNRWLKLEPLAMESMVDDFGRQASGNDHEED